MARLIVRGGTLVTPTGLERADITIEDGRIMAIGDDTGGGDEVIDASGQLVLPGLIDVHLHFNEPGRTSWEGAATGSRALAAGGGTLFFDMPLNSTPCTIGVADFDRKREALEASSITDFAIWGGLVPGSVGGMADMAARGVVGFKAFMCDSGLPEFPRADDRTLYDGLCEAARLGVPVAVHAESEELTRAVPKADEAGEVRRFLRSRPVLAELEAIQRALLLAQEAGGALHLVHVSSGRGVALAAEARARGVDVSIETCPHYLFFTEDDVERLGTVLKCTPPLRSTGDQAHLWAELLEGRVDMIASDHSPTEPALKQVDFLRAWGGVAGVQSTLAVLLESGHHQRQLPLERIVSLTAQHPARRFRLARKGALTCRNDADLVLVDLSAVFTLDAGQLQQRHKSSPYLGHAFRGSVRRTIRRGDTIFADGRITAGSHGRLVRPATGGSNDV
jgi:allantoinase